MNTSPLRFVSAAVVIIAQAIFAHALPPATMSARGIGAGGGMYCPVISPSSSQTVFVACDMSELFYTNSGGSSWSTVDFRQLQANQLTEVQYTNNPNILYALDNTYTAPDAVAVERPSVSVDGGVHWSPCLNWPSQSACNTVYATWNTTTQVFGANNSRLYVSNDSGHTWALAVDFTTLSGYSSNTKARLAGAFFDDNNVWIGSNCGLLYSSNSGSTFSVAAITGFNTNTESIVAFVGAKDPSSGTIRFYCVTANSSAAAAGAFVSAFYFSNPQIYRLDGSGSNWTATNVYSGSASFLNLNGISQYDRPAPIAMARNNINVVYVAADRLTSPGTSGSPFTYPNNNTVYKLSGAGGFWTSVFTIPNNQNIYTGWGGYPANGRLDFAYPLGICVDPNDATHVITCDDALVHQSMDGGANWYQMYVNPADQNAKNTPISASKTYRGIGLEPTASHWVDFLSSSTIFAGYSDLPFLTSINAGVNWGYSAVFAYNRVFNVIHNPNNGIVYALCSSLPAPYYIFGLSDSSYNPAAGAIYYSANNGVTWSVLKSYTTMGNAAPVNMTLDAPNDRLYVSTANSNTGGIWRIDNASRGAGANAPVQLAAPPRTQGHAFTLRVLSNGELVCSYSGRYQGSTPPNQGFSQSSGVFYSTDGGQTWADRSDPKMEYWTQEVVIDPYDSTDNTWYAGVWGTFGFTPYIGNANPQTFGGLYKTTNRGQSWTCIYNSDGVAAMAFNPNANHSNELYLCTEQSGLVYTGNLRDANGPTFTQVASFPFRQPTHVFFNPYASELWVTSYGNGILVGTIPTGNLQFDPAVFNTTEGQTATIAVSRVGGDSGAISVNYATSDGTATAPLHYTAASGTLSWADNDTADKAFTVTTETDQTVDGTQTVNITLSSPTNGAGLGSPNVATLDITDAPMDLWRAANFGANANNPAIGGDYATPANDGVSNLMKYALGLNPNVAIGGIESVAIENGYLTLSVARGSAPPSDVTLSPEVAGDLSGSWQANTTTLVNTASLFQVRDNVPVSSAAQRFMHLKVTRP